MGYGSILNQSFEQSPVLDDYFTKDETLTNSTAALYGLGAAAVPDNAFSIINKLIVGDRALVLLQVNTSNGGAAPGVKLSGATTPTSATPITDKNGQVIVAIQPDTQVYISAPGYADLSGGGYISAPAGTLSTRTITLSVVDFLQLTLSGSLTLSGACTRLDVCCVGGGAGGANAVPPTSGIGTYSGGNGGAAGQIVTRTNVSFSPNVSISYSVGSGGAGNTAGGSSSILDVLAAGGNVGAGGIGATVDNTNGGDGSGGSGNRYSSFTAVTTCGGDGGGGSRSGYNSSATVYGGTGRAPFGGNGANVKSGSQNATGFGGGGGGGAGNYGSGGGGGSGYQGVICVRMWHGEEETA